MKILYCFDSFLVGIIASVLPSSPPGREKSLGRMDHFWTRWALDTALLLAWSMPAWIA